MQSWINISSFIIINVIIIAVSNIPRKPIKIIRLNKTEQCTRQMQPALDIIWRIRVNHRGLECPRGRGQLTGHTRDHCIAEYRAKRRAKPRTAIMYTYIHAFILKV